MQGRWWHTLLLGVIVLAGCIAAPTPTPPTVATEPGWEMGQPLDGITGDAFRVGDFDQDGERDIVARAGDRLVRLDQNGTRVWDVATPPIADLVIQDTPEGARVVTFLWVQPVATLWETHVRTHDLQDGTLLGTRVLPGFAPQDFASSHVSDAIDLTGDDVDDILLVLEPDLVSLVYPPNTVEDVRDRLVALDGSRLLDPEPIPREPLDDGTVLWRFPSALFVGTLYTVQSAAGPRVIFGADGRLDPWTYVIDERGQALFEAGLGTLPAQNAVHDGMLYIWDDHVQAPTLWAVDTGTGDVLWTVPDTSDYPGVTVDAVSGDIILAGRDANASYLRIQRYDPQGHVVATMLLNASDRPDNPFAWEALVAPLPDGTPRYALITPTTGEGDRIDTRFRLMSSEFVVESDQTYAYDPAFPRLDRTSGLNDRNAVLVLTTEAGVHLVQRQEPSP